MFDIIVLDETLLGMFWNRSTRTHTHSISGEVNGEPLIITTERLIIETEQGRVSVSY